MVLLRSSVYFVLMMVTTVLAGVPMSTLGWLLPFETRCRIGNFWGQANMVLLRWVCGLSYRIQGWENLPEEPCIIMAKHQSAWETIALRAFLPPHQAWVLKKELMQVPIFGWALAVVHPIAIDRKAGRKAIKQVIEQGIDRLQKGQSVIIFPEGTRVAPGERGKYGMGGGLLAEKSGYPVVPIAHNAGVYWRRRGLKKYAGTIEVVIGPPIATQGRKAAAIMKDVEDWIEERLEELPQQLPGGN